MVVERLGRLHAIEQPGWFIAVPIIDKIAYRVRHPLAFHLTVVIRQWHLPKNSSVSSEFWKKHTRIETGRYSEKIGVIIIILLTSKDIDLFRQINVFYFFIHINWKKTTGYLSMKSSIPNCVMHHPQQCYKTRNNFGYLLSNHLDFHHTVIQLLSPSAAILWLRVRALGMVCDNKQRKATTQDEFLTVT